MTGSAGRTLLSGLRRYLLRVGGTVLGSVGGRRWLHRRGIVYSPSADLLYAQGSLTGMDEARYAEWVEQFILANERHRAEILGALGWETCFGMQAWDVVYADVEEPERWMRFECTQHDVHEMFSDGYGNRSYSGKCVADRDS